MNLYEDLEWRGLIADASPGVDKILAEGKVTAYIGFDPTATSLHVGTLLPIMTLARLQRHGHQAIALIGGGTGMVGDPSGKTKERQLQTQETVDRNVAGVRDQLAHFLVEPGAEGPPVVMLDNADWLASLTVIDFLRDVAKHFTVNDLIRTTFVKRRLEDQEGLSFTEFSYLLLQAYDFLHLYETQDCTLQIGGTDQWVNILGGTDLIRRIHGGKAYGIVSPLIVGTSGVKFGKTEEGAVWLDPARTSPYRYFQFWLNTDDRDAVRYLGYFTWLSRDEVDEIRREFEREPQKRLAQKTLAEELTRMTHGQEQLERAQRVTSLLFGGDVEGLSAQDLLEGFEDAPSSELALADLVAGKELTEILAGAGLASSKGDARRLIRGGGVYVNNQRVTDEARVLEAEDSVERRVLLLRKGKKQYHLVRLA